MLFRSDIKSRFCILKDGELKLSRDFGDLSDLNNFHRFKRAVSKIKTQPDIISFDMHPDYFSSQAADLFNGVKKVAVQHHHAHVAALLPDNDIKKPVIGVAFDGTGFGSDGNLWGGEFMIADKAGFKRAVHFKYLRMPGGEVAVREPWRMAFSLLYDCLGKDVFKLDLECLKIKPRKDYDILVKMLEKKINSDRKSVV